MDVMPPRVEQLVKGRAQRSYLKRDGWWAQLVVDEFDFLSGLGYRLETVSFFQDGHTVVFTSGRGRIVFEYGPDAGNWVFAYAAMSVLTTFDDLLGLVPLVPKSRPRASQIVLDALLGREPTAVADRSDIEDRVRAWAEGIRRLGPSVFPWIPSETADGAEADERVRVESAIRAAFEGVSLGSGMSLRQSVATENYLKAMTHEEYLRLPDSEVTEDWALIPEEEFPDAAVAHLDAEGLRYYLPPLMLRLPDLYDDYDIGVIGTVMALAPDDRFRDLAFARFQILSRDQRAAIRSYLLALPRLVDLNDHDAARVMHSLVMYWR